MRGLAVIPLLDEGLGNSAYLVGLGEVVAVLTGGAAAWAEATGPPLEVDP